MRLITARQVAEEPCGEAATYVNSSNVCTIKGQLTSPRHCFSLEIHAPQGTNEYCKNRLGIEGVEKDMTAGEGWCEEMLCVRRERAANVKQIPYSSVRQRQKDMLRRNLHAADGFCARQASTGDCLRLLGFSASVLLCSGWRWVLLTG
uniref:Uncharacterized protein n=1 Tax=Knipowitschia caucasica TaxID=637954 RepID=A0AAV2L9N6_KNICA